MRITKLLSLDSEPAKPILDRAKPIALAFLERIKLPETFVVGDQTIENALGEVRPLEVGDVLVDENGGFYKIEAPVETIFKVTGDLDLMQEAVYALTARGVRVAQTEDGFAVAGIEQYKAMLESVGLTVTAAQEPFTPVPLPRPRHGGCGCGCGGHHHHHDEGECGCGCGGHHHHDEGECGCGCGGHHHHDEGECCCGGITTVKANAAAVVKVIITTVKANAAVAVKVIITTAKASAAARIRKAANNLI